MPAAPGAPRRKPETRTGLKLTITIDGARETLKALNALPKEVNTRVRDASLQISRWLAEAIKSAGQADSPQSAAVAATAKAKYDRVPSISVGGTKKVTSEKVPAHKILFGANFGATYYRTPGKVPFFIHDHASKGADYWIWKTAEANNDRIGKEWEAGVDEALAWFERTGGGEVST